MYRIKPEQLYILSYEKGPRPKAEAFFMAHYLYFHEYRSLYFFLLYKSIYICVNNTIIMIP